MVTYIEFLNSSRDFISTPLAISVSPLKEPFNGNLGFPHEFYVP